MEPTVAVPSDSTEAAAHIERFTGDIVREALTVRALVDTLKGAKKFIEQAAREYAERFLFELIQNAYDAQPPGSRGRVLVALDASDGEFGCVYVANTGTPFTADNFRAICEIAQSSKQPGEGIGNKGVGFKSVLQVAAWPEIYSASAAGDGFDGYCFRFAQPADMRDLTASEEEEAALEDRISPYGLPIHIGPDHRPQRLQSLADQGYVSVIRLPLRTAKANEIARAQIAEALSPVAPILLFLDRLAALRVEIIESDGSSAVHELVREERPSPLAVEDARVAEVVVGEQQQYLVMTRRLERAAFLAAIEASIEATLVDEGWRDWRGDAEVSVAVRLDRRDEADTRLYCFLPMGAAVAGPFVGHVNAPFAVSLARDDLVRGAPLNEFLFDAAADIVASAAISVRDHRHGRAAVADLVGWEERHAARLVHAFERLGGDLPTAPIVPVLGGTGWSSLASAFAWSEPMRALTSDAVAGSGLAAIVDPSLGPERAARLDAIAAIAARRRLAPELATVAAWAEGLALAAAAAAQKRSQAFDPEWWSSLYDDLANVFARQDPGPLRGKRILIDDGFAIHPTWGGSNLETGSAVFFPLREIADGDDVTRDVRIPKTLGRHLAYLHAAIPWKAQNQQNRPGRDFLDRARLVRMPRTQALLERIASILERRRDKQLHADALVLVFNLTKRRSYTQEPSLDALHLRVPTRLGKWLPAADTIFSAPWPGTMGTLVERLIDEAAGGSADLENLRSALLAPPKEFGFRIEPIDDWTGFLRRIGVQDGLRPIDATPTIGDQQGGWWTGSFPATVSLPPEDHARWDEAVRRWPRPPNYPYTHYRITGRVMRLPGSGDYLGLPQPARETYGRLLVAGLSTWDDKVLWVHVARPRGPGQADPVTFPSPVREFLRAVPWLPVTRPGAPGEEDFVTPEAAWHYRDTDNEAQPTFMPLVVTDVRRMIDQSQPVADRLRMLGLNVWNDRADGLKRLRALARAYQRLDVAETLVANFRKAYERTWTLVTRGAGPEPVGALRGDDELVVTRRGRLAVERISEAADTYVLVDEDRLVAAVLDSIDVPVLPIDPRDGGAAAALIEKGSGVAVRTVGASDVRVFVDGEPVPDGEGFPLVGAGREWLADLVALTLELRASAFNRQSNQRIRAALDVLRATHLHAGTNVTIELRGQPVPLPGHLRRVFAVATPGRPAIAYAGDAERLDWDLLAMLAPKIGELIGTVETANALETVAVSLARRLGGSSSAMPSDEDYSAVFEESVERVAEIRRSQRGRGTTIAYLLRPAVIALIGEDPLEDLVRQPREPEPEAIAACLERVEDRLPDGVTSASLLGDAQAAASLAALRDRLGIAFADFNAALAGLGADYEPIRNPQGHVVAMAWYLARHRDAITDSLRGAALDEFDRAAIPAGYAAKVAELASAILRRNAVPEEWTRPLDPDPAWLDKWDLPPDGVLAERVADWLGPGAAEAATRVASLPSVDDARTANARALAEFHSRASMLLPLWSTKGGGVSAPSWLTGGSAEELVADFSRAGLLDFRLLDDAGIIGWLILLDRWPVELPRSLVLDELGLSESDVAAQRKEADRIKWERLQARRSVALDGRPVTLDPERMPDLLARLRAGLRDDLMNTSDRPVRLEEVEERRRRKSGSSRKDDKPGRPAPSRMTSDQTELVGFMGEVIADEWLRRRYGASVLWRSRYRRFVHNDGDLGNDDLGFDFEVLRERRGALMFEVKATTTDDLAFELSETEIAVAQENAGHDRYRILFVGRVNDSERRWLAILPNPLSAGGRGRYRIVGRGIRYEFAMAEGTARVG